MMTIIDWWPMLFQRVTHLVNVTYIYVNVIPTVTIPSTLTSKCTYYSFNVCNILIIYVTIIIDILIIH